MAKRGRVGAEQLAALREKIKGLYLQSVPLPEIASAVGLAQETVRKHIYVIREQWADQMPDVAQTRLELIQRANLVSKMAAGGAARARGTKEEATFLRLQLEVIDRIAKLTNTNVAIQINNVHEIDELPPEALAARLKMWANEIDGKAEILESTSNSKPEI